MNEIGKRGECKQLKCSVRLPVSSSYNDRDNQPVNIMPQRWRLQGSYRRTVHGVKKKITRLEKWLSGLEYIEGQSSDAQ